MDEAEEVPETKQGEGLSEDFSSVVPVSADPGEDVILPVHLPSETSAVSMEIRWLRGTELIYHYINGQKITGRDYEDRVSLSVQELERGNVSLTLRNVQESDSGKYICKVFHDGCLKTGIVHIQVRGPTSRRTNSMEGIFPLMAGESRGQHTTDGNTDTEQELLTIETQDLPREVPSAISSSRVRTQGQENPRATMQRTQERTHIEQERTSQTGSNTQSPERPEDRIQRAQRRSRIKIKYCQIM